MTEPNKIEPENVEESSEVKGGLWVAKWQGRVKIPAQTILTGSLPVADLVQAARLTLIGQIQTRLLTTSTHRFRWELIASDPRTNAAYTIKQLAHRKAGTDVIVSLYLESIDHEQHEPADGDACPQASDGTQAAEESSKQDAVAYPQTGDGKQDKPPGNSPGPAARPG